MKKSTLTLVTLLMIVSQGYAQIYVDGSATGSNDGSSWQNAYTDISAAVTAAAPGDQLWIAAGTYYPPVPTTNPDTAITIRTNIAIYGGFAGGETDLSERDFQTNRVEITGDHLGDDFVSDTLANTADNNRHIIFVDTTVSDFVIDGVTISHGKTVGPSGSGNNRRAGGILAFGKTTARNVTFTLNQGHFGGGFYPRSGTAAGSAVIDCRFISNFGTFGAGIYTTARDVEVQGCLFRDNRVSSSGGGIYLVSNGASVVECEFDDNIAVSTGAGIYNTSDEGAVISVCSFTNNLTLESRGAGIYNIHTPSTIMACLFEDNTAQVSSGAAIQIRSDDEEPGPVETRVVGCSFERNVSRFGGAIGVYDSLTVGRITGCSFLDNRADNVGGAISNAFGATTIIEASVFDTNVSLGSGGAVYSQNDDGTVSIRLSDFTGNTANFGGAMSISGDANLGSTLTKLNLDDVTIVENTGDQQGGGINLNSVNADISNTLIARNLNTEDESIGGGISINSGDTTQVFVSMINTTIADNEGSFFAGIAHFTGDVDGFSELTMQNCILANDEGGDNYTVEGGTPTLISNGGNLSSDPTTEDAFTNTNDINSEDPEFLGETNAEYHLADDSPCINTGVNAGAPDFDLLGNPRVGDVDKGAFEFQGAVSTKELADHQALQLYPNPSAEDILYVSLAGAFLGDVTIEIASISGSVIHATSIVKREDRIAVELPVSTIPKGYYTVIVRDEDTHVARPWIRL